MKVLITGGAGYLGSITATALEASGHLPVILDSLVTGPRAFVGSRIFYEGDIADRGLLRRIADEHPDLDTTIHMAGRTIVAESVANPYLYLRDNLAKSIELFDELACLGLDRVVFSSSASVYAPRDTFEVLEDSPLDPRSPYARSKQMVESALHDMASAGSVRGIILRYFNPVGADPELRSGMHAPEPSHALGQLISVARGLSDCFSVTGTEYPTRDGTGLRDYVHVWDLARAHVAAVEQFDRALAVAGRSSLVMNVGTGSGVTVRELISTFERVSGRPVPQRAAPPRPGDAVGAFANTDRIRDVLGWSAELDLESGITSALAWADKRRSVLGYA